MKIRWRPDAMADRDSIFDYIAQDNPLAAIELDEAFEAKAQAAARRPMAYKSGRVDGTRDLVVRPNYVLVYQIDDDGTTILRVLHAAQKWP
jgi:addiction module RelE/StbE family toxin